MLLTHRSCFYDRVSEKPLKMEIGQKRYGLRKIYREEGHFQVFHLKSAEINKIISIGGIKQL